MTLPPAVGEQRSVVAYSPSGHMVLLGTAGSGKTTMAIHRAARLAAPGEDHSGRTLLVTFNRSLVAYLNHLGSAELDHVEVRNFHHFARGYLHDKGLLGGNSILHSNSRQALVSQAVAAVRTAGDHGNLDRPIKFFRDELAYMQQQGLTSKEAYLAADRVGRGTPLRTENERPFAFAVFEKYVELRNAGGHPYDIDSLASAARETFESDTGDRRFRHIVIDEGQDFSPEMLRCLAAAIPEDGSLSFFGDVAQRIYGHGQSWRSAGLNVRQVKTFTRNYRNSPEVARLGLAIAAMDYFGDDPDMVMPTGFAAAGPLPTMVAFDSESREREFVVQQARQLALTGTVGVMARRNADVLQLWADLPGAQRVEGDMGVWNPNIAISCGTVHAMKGLEFDSVILAGASSDHWPDPMAIRAVGEDAAKSSDGKLLYVACTRAKQSLLVTHVGERTGLFPPNNGLWLEQVV